MTDPAKRTPIPKVEDYGDEYEKAICENCGNLFVLNAIGRSRLRCYTCAPPRDIILFKFRPKLVEGRHREQAVDLAPLDSNLRRDKMKLHICWCGAKMVRTSVRILEAGRRKSCGREQCNPPPP